MITSIYGRFLIVKFTFLHLQNWFSCGDNWKEATPEKKLRWSGTKTKNSVCIISFHTGS